MKEMTVSEIRQIEDFYCFAKTAFMSDKNVTTFGDIVGGGLLAIRWGMLNDGFVVIKIDAGFEPINFINSIKPNE